MARGRKLNFERRRDVAELRQQGYSLSEIGGRLGITRQRVSQLLQCIAKRRALAISCSAGGEASISTGAFLGDFGTSLYPDPNLDFATGYSSEAS
jgi:DNA-binding transcriptional regulator LsrR (DeoR family)